LVGHALGFAALNEQAALFELGLDVGGDAAGLLDLPPQESRIALLPRHSRCSYDRGVSTSLFPPLPCTRGRGERSISSPSRRGSPGRSRRPPARSTPPAPPPAC